VNTVERIVHELRDLPEGEAREVLDFMAYLKAKRQEKDQQRRERALELLKKHRGRFRAVKVDREELHDRPGLR
jgi:spore coat polysaccharide biosynthesis protein SpsF (cytidylyltransferase family)